MRLNTNFNEAAEIFGAYSSLRNDVLKALNEEGREVFLKASREIFDRFPSVRQFGWTQYTPYFNDGDECVFRTHTEDEEIIVNGVRGWSHEDGEYVWDFNVYRYIADFLQQINEELLHGVFGDHAEILINRDGTLTVTEYGHD